MSTTCPRCRVIEPNVDGDAAELAEMADFLVSELRRGPPERGPGDDDPSGRHRGGPDRRSGGRSWRDSDPRPPRDPGPRDPNPRDPNPRDLGPPGGRGAGPPAKPDFRPPWSGGGLQEFGSYVAGLAHCRAEHWETAIEYLEAAAQPIPAWRPTFWLADVWPAEQQPGQATALPALAIAYHHAGRADEAREQLDRAAEILDGWIEAMQAGSVGFLPVRFWVDYIEFHLLCREATELITGAPMENDPRLAILEQRALEAIAPE